jgi:hypothetical protein
MNRVSPPNHSELSLVVILEDPSTGPATAALAVMACMLLQQQQQQQHQAAAAQQQQQAAAQQQRATAGQDLSGQKPLKYCSYFRNPKGTSHGMPAVCRSFSRNDAP